MRALILCRAIAKHTFSSPEDNFYFFLLLCFCRLDIIIQYVFPIISGLGSFFQTKNPHLADSKKLSRNFSDFFCKGNDNDHFCFHLRTPPTLPSIKNDYSSCTLIVSTLFLLIYKQKTRLIASDFLFMLNSFKQTKNIDHVIFCIFVKYKIHYNSGQAIRQCFSKQKPGKARSMICKIK